MLTAEDIQKIILAEKEVFYTKQEFDQKFDAVKKDFSELQGAIDGLARQILTYHQEMIVASHRVNRMEEWIKLAAQKFGIPYNP